MKTIIAILAVILFQLSLCPVATATGAREEEPGTVDKITTRVNPFKENHFQAIRSFQTVETVFMPSQPKWSRLIVRVNGTYDGSTCAGTMPALAFDYLPESSTKSELWAVKVRQVHIESRSVLASATPCNQDVDPRQFETDLKFIPGNATEKKWTLIFNNVEGVEIAALKVYFSEKNGWSVSR